jgi:hypothetical protein
MRMAFRGRSAGSRDSVARGSGDPLSTLGWVVFFDILLTALNEVQLEFFHSMCGTTGQL